MHPRSQVQATTPGLLDAASKVKDLGVSGCGPEGDEDLLGPVCQLALPF